MGYRHGVFVGEVPTNLVPPVQVESALPVVIGTAPVHRLKEGVAAPVNEPRLISTFTDFVAQFGAPDMTTGETAHDFTLYEFARVFIGRYAVAPVVFINVFDPEKHRIPGTSGAAPGFVGVDEGGVEAVSGTATVAAEDVTGGVDATTGKRTGLALVDEVFSRFRIVPGQILAPGFSAMPEVALAIGAACPKVSGHFRAVGVIDMPASIVRPADAPAWINDNNLTDANLLAFFGTPVFGGTSRDLAPGEAAGNRPEWGSTHLAAVIAQRDSENSGIPFWSPSNKRLLCNGMSHNGAELHLTPVEASHLNGNGIVTGLNMVGGLVAWGDQTCAYPGVTEVKDTSIPIRRMFNWIGNTLILTAWQYASAPVRRRMIETVQDTFNVWLNGLAAREFILGGRVAFEYPENPSTDLMAGKTSFHVYVAPPNAAHEIEFTLEYDPAYLETLFAN